LIGYACRQTNITIQTLSNYRKKHSDFDQEVIDTEIESVDELEVKAHKKAMKGDSPMLRFMLACKRPKKYSQRYLIEHGGQVDINADLKVTVLEDEGWYGNDAHHKAAESAAPSIAGAVESGEAEGGSVRETVG
jgi:hypothetical protein